MSGLWCFNPLLIGEAAPPLLAILALALPLWFQPPSHRGGGAARQPLPDRCHCSCHGVSIPFSSGRRRRGHGSRVPASRPTDVSIPFSSGRRRRHTRSRWTRRYAFTAFQSPSHRGGGAACAREFLVLAKW